MFSAYITQATTRSIDWIDQWNWMRYQMENMQDMSDKF